MDYAGVIVHWIAGIVLDTEKRFGTGHGKEKKAHAIQQAYNIMRAKGVIKGNPEYDVNELLKLIGNLIEAIVALLNFLGWLSEQKAKAKPKRKG